MSALRIDRFDAAQRDWAIGLLERQWGSTKIVSRGRVHQAETLPGFVATLGNDPVGLATYHLTPSPGRGGRCELVSLDSTIERAGVGSALVAAVRDAAVAAGCGRLWLITTNDNLAALRFYQKRGFVLAALHRGALEGSRRLKPQIPLIGHDGIPLRDEIELEMLLSEGAGMEGWTWGQPQLGVSEGEG